MRVGGPSADELAYDPIHHIIAVTSPDATSRGGHAPAPHVTLIDAHADRKGKFRVIGEVAIPGAGLGSIEQPQWDGHNKVFVEAIRATTDFPHGAVAVIDPIHVRLQALLPIDGQCNPGGLAVAPGDQALLGCNTGGPAIINTSTGRILKRFDHLGACCADQVWFDRDDGRYYAAEAGAAGPPPDPQLAPPAVMVINATGTTIRDEHQAGSSRARVPPGCCAGRGHPSIRTRIGRSARIHPAIGDQRLIDCPQGRAGSVANSHRWELATAVPVPLGRRQVGEYSRHPDLDTRKSRPNR